MKLIEIVRKLEDVEVKGDLPNREVLGITNDSRKVKEGYIFACIPGFSTDGHLYIEDAVKRGAIAALVERFCEFNIPQIKVSSVRKVLPWVSSWVYGEPSKKLLCIGVTGTDGKTTTTFLTRSILEKAGYKPMLLGTIEYRFGGKTISASRTTPEAPDIMEFMNEGIKHGNDSLVMEVSSHSLCLHRVDSIDFDVGILTNITPEHLDFHGTFENYRDAKAKLFRMAKRASILNADDDSYSFMKSVSYSSVISYGIEYPFSDVRLGKAIFKLDGMFLEVKTPLGTIDIKSSLIGRFNIYNIMASIACGLALGIDLDIIKSGIEAVKGVPGRMEVFKKEGFPVIIIDYAHTPNALERVLLTIKDLKPQRIFCIFGLGGNRFVDNRFAMGKIAGSMAHKVLITSDNARWESPLDIAKQIAEGCRSVGGHYEIVLNRRRAIEKAIKEALPGDVVLIAGKGHEDYFEIRGQKRRFSDIEVVRDILNLER